MATTIFNPSIYGSAYRLNAAGETFATVRAGTGTDTDTANTGEEMPRITAHGADSDKWIQIRRSIYQFNTSSIPDGDIISSVKLYAYVSSKIETLAGQSTVVTACTPASTSALENDDYNIARWTDVKLSNELAIADVSTSVYNSYTLNTTGIATVDKTGFTKIGVRMVCDVDNSAPTWGASKDAATVIELASGGNNDAYLEVVHSPSSSTTGFFLC